MLSKGFPVNPGELPTSPEQWVRFRPTQSKPGLEGHEGFPPGSEQALDAEKPVAKGDQRRQLRVDEQSYKSMVPMKVENRRALAKRRPRYPLEGRDEQVDVSAQCHRYETQNSRKYVKWN